MEIWGEGQIDSDSTRVSFGPVSVFASVVAEADSVSAKVTCSPRPPAELLGTSK